MLHEASQKIDKAENLRQITIRMNVYFICSLLIAAIFSFHPAPSVAKLPRARPEKVGMSSSHLRHIKEVMDRAIQEKETPGGVVIVLRNGYIVYRGAFGLKAVEPEPEPISVDTIYDMASLTKVVCTTSMIMLLVQDGKLRLDDPVSMFIPEYKGGDKYETTLRHLLTHTSGLPPFKRYFEQFPEGNARQKIILDICETPLRAKPGEQFVYSDLGFILLGEIIERVTGMGLDKVAVERIFKPLGMKDTMFTPPDELKPRCAPTEKRNGKFLRGEVHDGNAWVQNGVSGHAGLFSTADDLAIFCQMLLDNGRYKNGAIFSPLTVKAMTSPQINLNGEVRGLGWDIDSHYSYVRGDLFPKESFGHTGWTGTSLWLCPRERCAIILLTNRNHPDEKGDVKRLRALVSNIVASSIIK
jgi:CubicO group peptidase (beta-lactamase class C family)